LKTLARLWKAESPRVLSIILALAAAGLIPGTWGKAIGVVLPLLGGQAVRSTVWAPATAQAAVADAATAVASQLAPDTVGPAGTVLPATQAVVDGVVAGVLGDGT